MGLLVMLVLALVWGTLGYRLAVKRGRRPALWAGLAAFFGIFAVGTLALLPSRAGEPKVAETVSA